MSLVGKDQETITEAIKEMAENVENVKKQEKEINDLHSELDDAKDKIHYLESKLNQKYDIIEDMEWDLDRADEKFKDVEKQLQFKDKELDELDKFIGEQAGEMNELRDNNRSMVSQISEKIEMEKKISIQVKVITELREKLKEQSEYEKDQEEVQKLSKDIEHLKTVSGEKVLEIEKISRINENLTAQLDVLHNEKKKDPNCLDDELGPHFSRTFKCKEYEKYIASLQLLRSRMKNDHGSNHLISTIKLKLHELELQIFEQKLDTTQKISKLKEAEQTCRCAGWCALNHKKQIF
jgi:chromosome segregation ATPase